MSLTSFEKDFKNKVNLKASQRQSEETVIVKTFRYFDLNDTGRVGKREFVKAVDKIGVVNFSENVTGHHQ